MRATALLAATLLLVQAPPSPAQQTLDIREWQVPYPDSRPRDPFAVDADTVWFVGQKSGYLARLDVASGEFHRVDLKPGSAPHNLIADPDGMVWYAGNRTALIGRHDPATGAIEEFPMPDPAARDPHTLVFDHSGENIWFTVQWGNMIGRLDTATGRVDLVESQTANSRPYGIKVGPDGTVWAVLFGTHLLARVDPATLELTEIELPRFEARPRRLEVTADGRVWYGDYTGGMLGVYDPAEGSFQEWPMPQGENAAPYGMASDDRGRIYLVATGVQPNVVQGFDPATGTFFGATPVPSGAGSIRHMHYHQPSGAVWFGTDANTIGRFLAPEG